MEADYSHLPTDVLRIIFAATFADASTRQDLKALPWELLPAYRQWLWIQLTCKHWQEVLTGTPPAIRLQLGPAPEEVLLKWLPTAPVRSLGAPEVGCWSKGADDEDKEEGEEEAGQQRLGRLLSTRQMLLGMEGISQEPFWSVAALQQLEVLHIGHVRLTDEEPITFDSSPLQGLGRLADLRLGEFTDFELDGLPGSIRALELCYDEYKQFSMPTLPPHLRLDRLKVGKEEGVVGLALGALWDCCREVALDTPQVMVGVPCPEALVRQFERPYREGIYVPPHILGDMEALEQSQHAAANCTSKDLFDGLSRSAALKVLYFGGGCGAGIKFVPMRAGDAQALPFIFLSQPVEYGRVRDVNYLFSVDAYELQGEAKQWLFEQECLAEDGEAPRPGFGGTGAVIVPVRMGQHANSSSSYPIPTVRVWREGDPEEPPTRHDYNNPVPPGQPRIYEFA